MYLTLGKDTCYMDVKEWVHAFACKFDMIVSLSDIDVAGH